MFQNRPVKQTMLFFALVLLLTPNRAEGLCEPLEDSPTARLMYHSDSLVMVKPRDPLPDGTTAKLKCSLGTSPIGSTMATCINGQWKGIPMGTCT